MNVTLSFDDGDRRDLQVVQVLERHGLRGTFFIPSAHLGRARPQPTVRRALNRDEVRLLAEAGHRLGSHGGTHCDLRRVSATRLRQELQRPRELLAAITGEVPDALAYPYGKCDRRVRAAAEEAGYRSGRLVAFRRRSVLPPRDALLERPTAKFTPGVERHVQRLLAAGASSTEAAALHLWGHSWEIDHFGLWAEFERVCALVGAQRAAPPRAAGQPGDGP